MGVALAVGAEVDVVARNEVLHAEVLDQELADEATVVEPRQGGAEGGRDHDVEAGVVQQRQLLAPGGQQEGTIAAPEHQAGVATEGEEAATAQAVLRLGLAHRADQRLMAEVQPVK